MAYARIGLEMGRRLRLESNGTGKGEGGMNTEGISTPGIAAAFWAVGCVVMGGAALWYFATSTAADGPGLPLTLSAILTGLVLVGFGSVLNYLGRIEQHMRKRPG